MFRRHRSDRGTISIYVAFLAPAILALAGLVIDGGGALVAKQRAADQAEQGARAGANAIDIAVLRDTGDKKIDCAAAQALVSNYFAAYPAGTGADVYNISGCEPGRITVHVEISYTSIFLNRPFQMKQDASASPICDVNTLCTALPKPPATASDPLVRLR